MINTEIMIVGAGQAGKNAALTAASSGAKVLLCDKDFKKTEKIGDDILDNPNIDVWNKATVVGIYEDNTVTVVYKNEHVKVKPQRLIVATGAIDRYKAFENNDLPGILSMGTVQTLITEYGIKPGNRVLIDGEADQKIVELMENAGVTVIYKPGYTILKAIGENEVTGAIITEVDRKGQCIEGTEESVECDTICVAAGRTPLAELCALAECSMRYVEELSGYVAESDENMETTRKGVFCAGDCAGIENEEAAAMQGRIAGYSAAISLGYDKIRMIGERKKAQESLESIRDNLQSAGIRAGLEQFCIRRQGGK